MSIGSIAAITGLLLAPLTGVQDFLRTEQPWFSFDAQGSVLQLVRAQRIQAKSCKAWTEALVSVPAGWAIPGTSSIFTWEGDDLRAVTGCDEYPCKVKLDQAETETLKTAQKEQRLSRFREIVARRAQAYARTQIRKPSEYPGEPMDPWKEFETEGLKPPLQRPAEPTRYERELNLAPGKMLTLHQVLDRRTVVSPTGSEAAVWIRDVYTDHYFDRWGEWELVNCDAAGKGGVVIQVLLADMDLLKNTGFFARAIFGKYRKAFEDQAATYLNARFERLVQQAAR